MLPESPDNNLSDKLPDDTLTEPPSTSSLPDSAGLSSPSTDHEHSVFPRMVRLTLHILPDVTRTLRFPHNARILVGRADDEESANDLMLELSHYGGESSGVSRIHAAIHDQHGMVYITDLNSTNGTRINGLPLVPDQSYRLREGDELQLGSLTLILTHLTR